MSSKIGSLGFVSAIVLVFFGFLHSPHAAAEQHQDPYEYFANSWALVGLKDYRDGTRMVPDGTLVLGDGAKCGFLIGEFYSPLPAKVTKTLATDTMKLTGLFYPKTDAATFDVALPVVRVGPESKDGFTYDFVVFATPLNPADKSAWDHPPQSENYLNHVCIRVQSEPSQSVEAHAAISLSRTFPAPETAPSVGEIERYVFKDNGKLTLLLGVPKGTITEKVGNSIRWSVKVPEKGAAEVYLVVPHKPLGEGEKLAEVPLPPRRPGEKEAMSVPATPLYFGEVLRRTTEFWKELLKRGAVIGVPEEKPSLTYYASIIYNFIGRDGTVIKPGEGFYDEFYLRDGAFQTHALDLAGFHPEAKESLSHFLKYQKPDGQFVSQQGELDGNGQALWALYAHYALTGDAIWLNDVYPAATKAVSWLQRSRQQRVPFDSPYFGILYASIADGENLMQTPKHIVGYDFWNLRGVDCVARMAEALGKKSEANEYRQLFQTYRECIENALKKAGADWFPPTYEGVGTSWGNLTMLHPRRVFDPWDERVTRTLDRVRAGFVEGTIRWGEEEKKVIHPYMSTYVTNSEVIRGEQDKAIDHFYHYLAHTTSTHGFPEGVHFETRTAWGDTVPHIWAAAQYMIVLRNMLLREDGDTLHLLSAVPTAWLRPGKKIVLLRAPTAFGEVDLALNSVEGGCEVVFSHPKRTRPKEVIFHMPPGVTGKRGTHAEDKEIPVRDNALIVPEGVQKFQVQWVLPPREDDRTFNDYAKGYERASPSR
ncbi:MAG: hypothetical protein Q8Q12_16795 [bacterium]|nr:hypothetical protein [bacterium]